MFSINLNKTFYQLTFLHKFHIKLCLWGSSYNDGRNFYKSYFSLCVFYVANSFDRSQINSHILNLKKKNRITHHSIILTLFIQGTWINVVKKCTELNNAFEGSFQNNVKQRVYIHMLANCFIDKMVYLDCDWVLSAIVKTQLDF